MKIGLISLGCPKNLVYSEVMLGLAREAGHELTADADAADVLVVNTCAFIDSAKRESIDTILEMAQHKKDGACRRLIVTGCLAERYRDALKADIPEIDAILGTGEVPDIVRAIAGDTSIPGITPLRFLRAPSTLHPAPVRVISTTPRHHGCWQRPLTTPISRSPKAATTSVRSASFRRCAAPIGAAAPTRSSGKPVDSRPAA